MPGMAKETLMTRLDVEISDAKKSLKPSLEGELEMPFHYYVFCS